MKGAASLRRAVLLIAAGVLPVTAAPGPAYAAEHTAAESEACQKPGTWLDPASGKALEVDELTGRLAKGRVVLLGEEHSNAEHHRWQLYTLAALHGRKPEMVLGFEMFPRRVQPALDRWIRGELDVESFFEASDWKEVWAFDPQIYLPLFHFARLNRVPMIALNVERALVSRVGREGWAEIPADKRAGLSNPIPASAAYRASLARTYLYKQSYGAEREPEAAVEEADIASVIGTEEFARFVEAQLTWDRAMAEALAAAHQRQPAALVVGVMGRGHIEYRHGVPQQLADLEIPDAAVLLPVDRAEACDGLPADLADAVFVIELSDRMTAAPPKARLGILVKTTDDGVRVENVLEGSVAEATAIEVDDIVVSAAGFLITQAGELIEIVERQAPGTWLPLIIRRGGEEIELAAKFPTVFGAPE